MLKARKIKERTDKAGIHAIKKLGLPAHVTLKIEVVVENEQAFVREDVLWNKVIESSYLTGPFDTHAEAEAYASQRVVWYERSVQPIRHTDAVAEPFIFVWPEP